MVKNWPNNCIPAATFCQSYSTESPCEVWNHHVSSWKSHAKFHEITVFPHETHMKSPFFMMKSANSDVFFWNWGRRSWSRIRCGRRCGHDHRLRPGLLWKAPRWSVLGGCKSMENCRKSIENCGKSMENCGKAMEKCRNSMGNCRKWVNFRDSPDFHQILVIFGGQLILELVVLWAVDGKRSAFVTFRCLFYTWGYGLVKKLSHKLSVSQLKNPGSSKWGKSCNNING